MPEIKSFVCTRFKALGPIRSPATISPATWGAFSLRATSPKNLAKIMMMARERSISSVSIFSSPS